MAKEWSVEHCGHRIRVVNEASREVLEIDGKEADSRKGLLAMQSLLMGVLEIEGRKVLVEARIGSALGAVCHIFVDGQLVGGDTDKKLPNFQDDSVYEKGRGAFLLKAICIQGLPFAAIMVVVSRNAQTLLAKGISFLFYALFFGLAMGFMGWRSVERAAMKRREMLASIDAS